MNINEMPEWEIEASAINELVIMCDDNEVCAITANNENDVTEEHEWELAKLIASVPKLCKALKHLIHLHSCEQEGMSSGQHTSSDWLKAYDDGVSALENAGIDLSE